jgi:hypothetical protein
MARVALWWRSSSGGNPCAERRRNMRKGDQGSVSKPILRLDRHCAFDQIEKSLVPIRAGFERELGAPETGE